MTAVLGALVLAERLTPLQIMGAVLVVVALAVLPFADRRSPRLRAPALVRSPVGVVVVGDRAADLETRR
jgi:hypothetical protein